MLRMSYRQPRHRKEFQRWFITGPSVCGRVCSSEAPGKARHRSPHRPALAGETMETTRTTIAGTAGRIAGTTARGLLWLNEQIDWPEVGQIVLQGLQILIVLTLLAGRYSRRAWDHLPVLSAQLGSWYAGLLVPEQHLLAPITAIMAAAREALERLVRRLYPVLAFHTSSPATSATMAS
jgi:hypothetical protein